MNRDAVTEAPLLDPISKRWSPRAFRDEPVERSTLATLLEAARWAPSCFNEQPWRFVVATRDQPAAYERLAGLLNPANRGWASKAPVLILTGARGTFTRNDKPNAHAWHDLGLAVGQMLVQATAEGLHAHQMAGFDREAAVALFDGDEPITAVTIIALGVAGDPDTLPENLAARERAPRSRRALDTLVRWGDERA